MNRSARSLLRVSVLASFAAAIAVAAAPTDAAPAKAAPSAAAGPSTLLLYETAAASRTVVRTLPAPVTGAGARTAALGAGAADGVPRAVPPAGPGPRAARARCRVRPAETVESSTGLGLPDAQPPAVGQAPIGGLSQGGCPGATQRDARDRKPGTALPVLSGGGGDVPGTLLGGTGKLGKGLPTGKLGKGLPTGKLLPTDKLGRREAARSAEPNGRAAETPISLAGPGPNSGLPDLRSLLGGATSGGLPLGSALFPPAARYAGPAPSGGLAGQAAGTVNKAGSGLGKTEGGVGSVVDVLKSRDGARRTADGGPAGGPLSMPDASALGVPKVPALPAVPGVPVARGRG
ncbi:hypothetical protein [Actinomadura mexicana]|uniref:Uncharacterized protein n=1 Tax=Actinomadura mexicana TaxID=134959 RepID=A0A238VSW7_9ACTN|nr:hypothetical protein [Actinomadura mexicana]SNR37405.1 hypothetical protein SAMN06265355_102337 [Actinomadura mexicana]